MSDLYGSDVVFVIVDDEGLDPAEAAMLISHKVGDHVPLDVGMRQMELYSRGVVEMRPKRKLDECPVERKLGYRRWR